MNGLYCMGSTYIIWAFLGYMWFSVRMLFGTHYIKLSIQCCSKYVKLLKVKIEHEGQKQVQLSNVKFFTLIKG